MLSLVLVALLPQPDDVSVSFIGATSGQPLQFILPPENQVRSVSMERDDTVVTKFVGKPGVQLRGARWVMDWHVYDHKASRMYTVVAVWGDAQVRIADGRVISRGVYYVGEFDVAQPVQYTVEGDRLTFRWPAGLDVNSKLWVACSRYAPSRFSKGELPALDEVARVIFTAPELEKVSIMVPTVPDF
jgi:hypothetical protein